MGGGESGAYRKEESRCSTRIQLVNLLGMGAKAEATKEGLLQSWK